MSPKKQTSGPRVIAKNNIYTALLALVLLVMLATIVFVGFKYYSYFGTKFPMIQ
jgi:hypothetical protein